MKRRPLAVLGALLVIGCDAIFGPDLTSDLEIELNGDPAAASALEVQTFVSIDGWRNNVSGDATIQIPAGDMTLDVIIAANGQRVASFRLSQKIELHHAYGIGVYVDAGDPRSFAWVACEPSVLSAPAESKPPEMQADSLYVTWFGLPKGAIC